MPKIKLDVKKIKELLTARLEILGLSVAGILVFICLIMGILTLFESESPATAITENADKIAKARKDAPKPPKTPKDKEEARVWEWKKVTEKDTLLTTMTPFLQGSAGSNLRSNPRIMAVDGDAASFQLDYLLHGIHTYDFKPSDEKLYVFTGEKREPVLTVAAKRLVVVTGTFPYHEQVEEYRTALRLDKVDDVFLKQFAPIFEGLDVERRKITKKGGDGEDVLGDWVPLYTYDPEKDAVDVNPKIKDLLTTAVYDMAQAGKYQEFIYGSSVTPLPLLTRDKDYPPIKLTAITDRKPPPKPADIGPRDARYPMMRATAAVGRGPFGTPRPSVVVTPSTTARDAAPVTFDELEPLLRDQVSGNINWFSPYGNMPEDINKPAKDDPNKPAKQFFTPPADPSAPKLLLNFRAPYEMPASPKGLIRFVDVDMEPGATYQYRVKARFANPNFGQPAGVVAHSGLADVKQLISSSWAETPPITIPPDDMQFYITHQDRDRAMVTRQQGAKAIDRGTNAAAADLMVPFQVQRFADTLITLPGKYAGDWIIAERLLVARGQPIGRDCEVEMVVWDKRQSQWMVNGMPARFDKKEQQVKRFSPIPVYYDFRLKPEVVLLDFAGGSRKYVDPRNKFLFDETSAVQALLLMPDMTMRLRNSQDDALSPERQEVFDAWRGRLETLSTPSEPLKDKK